MTRAQVSETQKVQEAVEKLRVAMVDADRLALEQLVTDKLSYGHSSGKLEDKKMFVESLVSGQSDFLDISFTNQTVEVVDNTAIVRHKLAGNTKDAGKEAGTVKLSVLLVWVKQNQEWKLLARQAVK